MFKLSKNLILLASKPNLLAQECFAIKLNRLLREAHYERASYFGEKIQSVNHVANGLRCFHTNYPHYDKDEDRALITFKDFENAENKNKEAFLEMIQIFEATFPNKKGYLQFIRSALKHMDDFGVKYDLEVYKRLIDIIPKNTYDVRNKMQLALNHYPEQQDLAYELLHKMEMHGVIPDLEFIEIMKAVYGNVGYPTRRAKKFLYWGTKFRNKSPWHLPKTVTSDPFLLGKLAVERITSVDIQTEISVYQTEELSEAIDKTWIISGQSPKQKELLKNHKRDVPVIVEGGDVVWLRHKCVSYFVLKADCEPFDYIPPRDDNDFLSMQSMYFNPDYVEPKEVRQSIHEQDDGIIYAVAATGTSSKDSLLSWVRLLQKNGNPILGEVPVLFRFKTPEKCSVPQPVETPAQGLETKN